MDELFDGAGVSRQTKLIADAVINFYAAYVHSLLYSYKHPLISDSLKNAFHALEKAFRTELLLRLETHEGKLMVKGKILDDNPAVLGNFVSWLNSMNIKAVSFLREFTRRDLIAFHKIIATKNITFGEISRLMTEKNITSISLHPVNLSSDTAGTAQGDVAEHKGLIRDFEGTMYFSEKKQNQSPFFIRPSASNPFDDVAAYGPAGISEISLHHEGTIGNLNSADTEMQQDFASEEKSKSDRYTVCVEALIDQDISREDRIVLRTIPPHEMAHLLNAMLFSDPGKEVAERIIKAYFGENDALQGEEPLERCRIFLSSLKSHIQPSFLLFCASLFNSETLLANQSAIVSEVSQRALTPKGDNAAADYSSEQNATVPCRTIEGSDFSFDFIAFGNAVLHDIEIPKETTVLLNKTNLAQLENAKTLDALASSLQNASADLKFQASIIAECTEDAITDASFDVVLNLLESPSLTGEVYQKLEGSIASIVEVYLERGDFDKILEMINVLKTQSLQGRWSDHAETIIRRVFSSDKINRKVVDALRHYGRRHRQIAYKLTGALQSFLIPHLLDALSHETDTSIRRFFMSLLISVRSEAVDHIARRLRDNSWYVVRNMLYLLRECKGRNHAAAVRDFLEHEEPIIRLEALRTLLSFQDPEADVYVKKFLLSNIFHLQKGTVRLTGAYRIKHALPHLVRLLRENDIRGKKSNFKRGVVLALGRIGDSRALHHFLNICNSPGGTNKVEFDKLKIEIFRSLHNYPITAIGPLIDYGMHSDNEEIVRITKNIMQHHSLPGINREDK